MSGGPFGFHRWMCYWHPVWRIGMLLYVREENRLPPTCKSSPAYRVDSAAVEKLCSRRLTSFPSVIMWNYHDTYIKIKKLTLVQYHQAMEFFRFPFVQTNTLWSRVYSSLVWSRVWQFLHLPLIFMTLVCLCVFELDTFEESCKCFSPGCDTDSIHIAHRQHV